LATLILNGQVRWTFDDNSTIFLQLTKNFWNLFVNNFTNSHLCAILVDFIYGHISLFFLRLAMAIVNRFHQVYFWHSLVGTTSYDDFTVQLIIHVFHALLLTCLSTGKNHSCVHTAKWP
jgi:hypothetical protein